MDVVVTGAGGYVGPHVVTALINRGHTVRAVVRNRVAGAIDDRAQIIEADLLSPNFRWASIGSTPDAVVHLAWKDGFVHNSPAHMDQLSGHFRLLVDAAAAGVGRIVALGTMHEVGYWEGAVDGSTPTNPLSLYGVAKDALRRALPIGLPDGTSLAWLRCFYIYGDDRRNSSVFTRILEAADAGKTEFPFTSGKNQYDFIHVADLGEQIAAVTEAWDVVGIVNCATGTPLTLAEKAEQFITENELDIRLQYGAYPDRPYDSPGTWGDAGIITAIMART